MSGASGIPVPSAAVADVGGTLGGSSGGTSLRGVYLTDGVFLYRVVGDAHVADHAVELEDCYLLDTVRIAVSDLRRAGLRVVVPASQ